MPRVAPYSPEFRAEAVRLLRSSGRSVPQLARELGVSEQSLRNWSRQVDVDDGRATGLSSDERGELRRLRRENRILAEERDILKKPRPSSPERARPGSGVRFIAAKKAEHSIQMMCRVLGVSRSGVHAWAVRRPSRRAVEDQRLTDRIVEIHASNRRVYGSPRIHAELQLEDGLRLGRKRVARLMRQAGLGGLIARKRGRTTIKVPGVRVCEDLVDRAFATAAPNRVWVADIT